MPGKKPCLGSTQQEPRNIELGDAMYGSGKHGHKAPGDEDAGNPNTRANLVEEKIAGDLEDEIAKKEYSDDQPKLRACDG